MLIIEDYFLLVDDNEYKYQIEPVLNNSNPNVPIYGIKIKRQLLNGYIHAEIYGQGQDDDSLVLKYYTDEIMSKPKQSVRIESKSYGNSVVRDAIRSILILDKNPDLIKDCDC